MLHSKGIYYEGLMHLGNGAPLASMLWGCIAIFAIINKPLRGAVAAAGGALLALFGVIHAPVVMKELMVVAIGGNSIIKDNASQSVEHQAQAVKAVAESVLEMLASDYDIVLTHGNGPQVGLDLRRAEIAHEREGLPLTPLANCVADTQGGIGYLIQQALNNRLAARGEQKAVTVVTQVEVDKNDPGFTHPTKPIGAFFSEAQRDELQRAHPDWHFVE
ncbi:MAG: carbamate kinase family protein, partial [Enterobacter mori]|nr:carbamate kinase family protein [Enterobacter mori]